MPRKSEARGATHGNGNIWMPSSVSLWEPHYPQVYIEAIAGQEGDENIGDGLEDLGSDDRASNDRQRRPGNQISGGQDNVYYIDDINIMMPSP